MYFALDPQQLARQAAVREFAATYSREADVRAQMATPLGFNADAWKVLAGDLGVVTLGASGSGGGAGGAFVDAVSVLEVLGENLYCGPYLASMLASQLLANVHHQDSAAGLLASLADGTSISCVTWPRTSDQITIDDGPAGSVIDGSIAQALDASLAEQLLIGAPNGAWYLVEAGAPGLARVELATLDQTRKLARIELRATPARRLVLAPGTDAPQLRRRLAAAEQIGVAADQLGVTRFCLNAAIGYARQRHQFGRPIGSFQALQHQFAEIALALECAWAATYQAAWCYDHRLDELERAAALAASAAGDAALAAAEHNVQIHAGVGFTWDNPAHLYFKRAKSNQLIWGHPNQHRDHLADLLSLSPR